MQVIQLKRKENNQMENDKLLKIKEVCSLLNISTRKFYEDIKTDQTFPQSFRLANTKTKLYSQKEIREWINLQMQNNRVS